MKSSRTDRFGQRSEPLANSDLQIRSIGATGKEKERQKTHSRPFLLLLLYIIL